MDKYGLPLLLIVVIWGLLPQILRVFEMLNERRDKILDPDPSKYSVEHRRLLYESDWKGLVAGVRVMFVGTAVLACISVVVLADATTGSGTIAIYCTLIVAFFVAVAWSGDRGGSKDRAAMLRKIAELEQKSRDSQAASQT
jgi:hypothetical protein